METSNGTDEGDPKPSRRLLKREKVSDVTGEKIKVLVRVAYWSRTCCLEGSGLPEVSR